MFDREHVILITIILMFLYALISVCWYLNSLHKYWRRRNVPHPAPLNFIFGNAADWCLGRRSMIEYFCGLYQECRKRGGVLGVYMFYKPTLHIGDLNLINLILNKDFRHFTERGLNFDVAEEPLTRHIFHLEGARWKVMRKHLNPAFSSRGVSQLFLPMLASSADKLCRYLEQILRDGGEDIDLDAKDIVSRYAADVIGICAYGIDSRALQDGSNQFHRMSKKIFAPRLRTILKLLFPKMPKFLVHYFDVKMVETPVSEYFSSLIENQLKLRRCRQPPMPPDNAPNDFLTFMMELQHSCLDKEEEDRITDEMIMAQCFMFFIAGYENATGLVCTILHELAIHPQMQERLYGEISDASDGKPVQELTYENINSLVYLDMVVSEALRLYPPAIALIRECGRDYLLPGTDLVLEKGLQLVIPVCGIHRDAAYYRFPSDFNPENFTPEEKALRPKGAFIPFGDGPRYCIGRTFGVIQVKVAIISLLKNFKFRSSPKMKLPIVFEKGTFVTSIQGGTWVKAERRSPI